MICFVRLTTSQQLCVSMALEKIIADLDEAEFDDIGHLVDQTVAQNEPIEILVEKLGVLLTAKDLEKRKKGLEFLTRILETNPNFDERQIHFLLRFYLDRVKDSAVTHSIVVRGIASLMTRQESSMTDGDFIAGLTAFNDQLQAQSFNLETRAKIIDIFSFAILNKMDAMKKREFSAQLINGFLQSVGGETNPKNLLKIFSTWPLVIKSMDNSERIMFLEDIFENISCYFPIDFDPPMNSQVTVDDLKNGLKECFAASADFAQYAVPVFYEKLTSEVNEAKLDSVLYLHYCLESGSYPVESLESHLSETWKLLKQEILGVKMNADERVKEAAKKLLKLLSLLMREAEMMMLDEWTELTFKDLSPFLKFVESNFMEKSVEILLLIGDQKSTSKTLNILMENDDEMERKLSLIDDLVRNQPNLIQDDLGKLLQFCQKGSNSIEECVRNASIAVLIESRGKVNYANDELNAFLTESFFKRNFLSVEIRVKLASIILEIDPKMTLEWVKTQIPLKDHEEEIAVLTQLALENDEIFRLIAAELIDLGKVERLIEAEHQTDYLIFEQRIFKKPLNVNFLAKMASKLRSEDYSLAMDDLISDLVDNPDSNSRKADIICSLNGEMLKRIRFEPLFAVRNPSESVCKVIGSIVNKIDDIDEYIGDYLKSVLERNPRESDGFCWIAKGVLMRGSPQSPDFTRKALNDFKTTLNVDDFLTILKEPQNEFQFSSKILPFYKQKFFSATFDALIGLHKETKEEKFLEAALAQLNYIPRSAVETTVAPVLPRLIRSVFDPSRSSAKLGPSAAAFLDFIHDNADGRGLGSEQAVKFLLRVSNEASDVKERVSALEAVKKSSKAVENKELRAEVIKKTKPLLDDKKRLVRKAAAEARNEWILKSSSS